MSIEAELDIRRIKFDGALKVALVLKVFAVLLAILTIAWLAVALISETGIERDVGFYLVGSSAAAAALFAAAGYGLEILVEIYAEVWRLRVYAGDDEDD